MTTHTYRLTDSEYARYLAERDPLTEGPASAAPAMARVRDAHGKWVTDGSSGSSAYDAGWYWVRTSRPVEWL